MNKLQQTSDLRIGVKEMRTYALKIFNAPLKEKQVITNNVYIFDIRNMQINLLVKKNSLL